MKKLLMLSLGFMFLACSNTVDGVKEDSKQAAKWSKEKVEGGAKWSKYKVEEGAQWSKDKLNQGATWVKEKTE